MLRFGLVLALAFFLPIERSPHPEAPVQTAPRAPDGPTFNPDGKLAYPGGYREWVYLTSGLDMSYDPKPMSNTSSMFDNVFVNPSAYHEFVRTGAWPQGTVLVIENRVAEKSRSINRHGQTQAVGTMGLEVHVKDSAHIKGGWGFYGFDSEKSAALIPRSAGCNSCHEQHGAVDTTFTQFYPTLIGIAKAKGTLSKEYVHEMSLPESSSQ